MISKQLSDLSNLVPFVVPLAVWAFGFGRHLVDKDKELNGVYLQRLQSIRQSFRDQHVLPLIIRMITEVAATDEPGIATRALEVYFASGDGSQMLSRFDRLQEEMLRFTRAFESMASSALMAGTGWFATSFFSLLSVGVVVLHNSIVTIVYLDAGGMLALFTIVFTIKFYVARRAFDSVYRQLALMGDS